MRFVYSSLALISITTIEACQIRSRVATKPTRIEQSKQHNALVRTSGSDSLRSCYSLEHYFHLKSAFAHIPESPFSQLYDIEFVYTVRVPETTYGTSPLLGHTTRCLTSGLTKVHYQDLVLTPDTFATLASFTAG